ncbi:MAG: SDR family oxidoreductase [Pseudomonadales bacterium]|nr:SDR family oxidoreductase [Pseudomonadales bacterium]
MNPSNRKALVLGGTSGIGLATALQLKALGATVIVFGRSAANLDAARAQGLDARAVDVLDRDALAGVFAACAPFDILVNAATGGPRAAGPFLAMDLDAYQASFQKLWGYTNAVRLAAGHMPDDGTIVLVSGAPARRPRPGQIALCSVGGAVEAFVRGVAGELAPRRINVVSPGIIDTPMFSVSGDAREKFLQQATGRHLIPRAGTPDEVAQGILFAITNDFVTGTTIDVDGGWLQS